MRTLLTAACMLMLAAPGYAATPKTDEQKINYIIGYQLGAQLGRDGIKINDKMLLLGVKEAMAKTPPQVNREEAQAVMEKFQAKRDEKAKEAGVKNLADGKAFLEKNKKKSGVKTLDNGLQYKIIKTGKGKKPAETDTVKVHYTGTLIDGTEFDSSHKRGEPASFPVNRVIKGWTAILQIMPVGSHWKVFIPSDLAYGEQGAGANIGPNSTLIFDVELLSIEG